MLRRGKITLSQGDGATVAQDGSGLAIQLFRVWAQRDLPLNNTYASELPILAETGAEPVQEVRCWSSRLCTALGCPQVAMRCLKLSSYTVRLRSVRGTYYLSNLDVHRFNISILPTRSLPGTTYTSCNVRTATLAT